MDPFAIFSNWYEDARQNPPFDPDVVALATATTDGLPSVRMVLYRGMREGGLSFFTNYESRKGQELLENPRAALAFYWPHMGKQVRIEGTVERLSAAQSDIYFQSRPFRSQITTFVSRQSRPLPDVSAFRNELQGLEDSLRGNTISRPDSWGGFKVMPLSFEFWIRGDHRRHDRMLYRKVGETWNAVRLYP